MGKLSKLDAQRHIRACELVGLDRPLSEDEKLFVLTYWHESATTVNSLTGAFFTPMGLARDMAIEVIGDTVIDLCAGIGRLAWQCRALTRRHNGEPTRSFVCVERDPNYVAVGRKVLPEAEWICADVFDLADMTLPRFDCAISNPPFGTARRQRNAPRYRGSRTEYHVLDLAGDLADYGVFILPQSSAPFRYSGQPGYVWEPSAEYERFRATTGVELEANCGIDTSGYRTEWRDVMPTVEIVTADLHAARTRRAVAPSTQTTLFSAWQRRP